MRTHKQYAQIKREFDAFDKVQEMRQRKDNVETVLAFVLVTAISVITLLLTQIG